MTAKPPYQPDADALLRGQRSRALARDQAALCALHLFAQVDVGLCLYVYDHVSTPGYLSVLLTVPFALALLFWARRAALRLPSDGCLLDAARGGVRRALAFLLLLHALLDAALLFHGLCALILDVMPDAPPLPTGFAVAAFAGLTLVQPGDHALPRLARLLRFLIPALLLYGVIAAIPHGKAAHFFPLLGYGPGSVGQGAMWLCGAASGCVWPLLAPEKPGGLGPLAERSAALRRPVLLALLAGAAAALVSAWLLPVYGLARPRTLGWRLLLVTHMTPSVAAWSLELAGLTLLLMLGLCDGLTRAGRMLSALAGRKRAPAFAAPALALLLLPAAFAGSEALAGWLIRLAPWRGAAMAFVVLTLYGAARNNAKKPRPGKEAAP